MWIDKALDTVTGGIVALKRVRSDKGEEEGIPITSIREIQILKTMNHPNIVSLYDVAVDDANENVFLVFEYVEHDLSALLDSTRSPFTQSEVKRLSIQCLRAVEFMHANWVMHRDLKLPNLLYSNDGVLKVADFGLARYFGSESRPMTPRVVTLWYRPPELLFGSQVYTESLDMWAVGCIIGELLLQQPLLPGKNEFDQIHRICNLLGTPNEHTWPGMSKLPQASLKLPHQPYNNLGQRLSHVSPNGLDLLNRLLAYDPTRRMTATEALAHPYFTESPLPAAQELMPTFPNSQVPKTPL